MHTSSSSRAWCRASPAGRILRVNGWSNRRGPYLSFGMPSVVHVGSRGRVDSLVKILCVSLLVCFGFECWELS